MSDKRLKLTEEEREKLTQLYKEKGFTQEKLADKAGISLDTLKQMLGTKGDKDLVNKWDIKKVAEALSCHPTEFMNPLRWNPEKNKYTGKFQELIEVKIRKFVGREFVFKAFKKFIETHDRGYFTVVGDPGEGKSTVAAKYVDDHPFCLYYFNTDKDSESRADQFLKCICQQLICEYGLENYQPDSLPKEATEDSNFLKDLLQQVSNKLKPHKKVVIVVDALDEVNLSYQQNRSNILYLPRYLPKGVYFLLTRRRELETRLLFETPQEIFDFKDYTMNSRDDIKKYIDLFFEDEEFKNSLNRWIVNQNLKKTEFIDTLAEKSENNFMYLECVLPEIAKGYYQNLQLENLPQGLTSYYEDHWRRMGMQDKPLPKLKIKIVYILSVLHKPRSRQLIAKFASVKDEIIVQEILNEWSQFLHFSQIQGQTRYKVYHASFADFLFRKEII